MKKADESFLKYALAQATDPHFSHWLKVIAKDFHGKPVCDHCLGMDIEIIVDLRIVKRCRECGNFSSNIDIDKIQPTDYNAVTFLHEDKIVNILNAQGARIK